MKKAFYSLILFISIATQTLAEDGHRLWLRYEAVHDAKLAAAYRAYATELVFPTTSDILGSAKDELLSGLGGLLNAQPRIVSKLSSNGAILIASAENPQVKSFIKPEKLSLINEEGYIIQTVSANQKKFTVITGKSDKGVLYGVFAFLKLIQTQQPLSNLSIADSPKINVRILNHWDNLDRTVERGYSGFSLWDWHRLPGYLSPRYVDYARANASVGINGTVLNNVNANALILTKPYLEKVAALANVFRKYGIKVYLTARFSAPIEIGGLKTADPLNEEVKAWWKTKAKEIYSYVPDFGGFLVKANSEGQPGPQNYGRNHVDGANLLADALEPFGGIVMWRAFVYDNNVPDDRAKQAYNEFTPLDGKFRKNVIIQVKNGAIDFQPREPFHPLFGAMPQTPLMMEFQLTQEYLGFATHLVYLAPLFKETLDSDTYSKGKGSTVAKVIEGTLNDHKLTGMAGVANIGNDINWTGHPFAQANWYAFGRLAWNPNETSANIASDWLRMSFSADKAFNDEVKALMTLSREAVVNYMTPLGLHHIMGWGHHYGPGPWIKDKPRADWTSVYYHKADENGIGFNRTSTGSNALAQYAPEVREMLGSLKTCPEQYLLWFHHLPWDYKTQSGRTLWNELCYRYNLGVNQVAEMQKTWEKQQKKVDKRRFEEVKQLLAIQHNEAKWWRDACLLYFQTFSKKPIPAEYEKPAHTLDFYQKQEFHFVPGN